MALICPSCHADNDDSAEMCFTCGRGLSGLTQGTVIASRYEILKPLGKGGMGMVYRAHDRALDETVALKLLRAEIAQDPEMAKRFRSEIKLARKVRHPNVCAIHEYGEDGGRRFIAMEFIEGLDLRQELRRGGALPPDEAYEVAIEVAEGLQAVHNAGIIHRDLKTLNIMRDARGVVRLMDFGIAKQYGSGATTGATATGHIVGTPEYMSPEQCRGLKVDTRSDIYALGVVIFEIFTGDVPFRGDTPLATLLQHLQEPPPLEGRLAARIPAPLVPVLRRALAKSREERYATALELAEALRCARARSPSTQGTSAHAPVHRTVTVLEPVPIPETTPLPTPVPTPVPTSSRTAVPTAVRAAPAAVGRGRRVQRWTVAAGGITVTALAALGTLLVIRDRTPPAAPESAFASSAEPARKPITPSTPSTAPEATGRSAPLQSQAQLALPSPDITQAAARLGTARPSIAAEPRQTAEPERAGVRSPAARLAGEGSGSQPTATTVAAPSVPTSSTPATAASDARVEPTAAPAPSPPTPVAAAPGRLVLKVKPSADAFVDGVRTGRTPLVGLELAPGTHMIELIHPDFEPFRRAVTIRSGESSTVVVDLKDEAVRRKP